MDVFLVPLGAERHELYCEVPDDDEPEVEEAAEPGVVHRFMYRVRLGFIVRFFQRMRLRFREMLAEAERERRQTHVHAPPSRGWAGRVKARTMRWVAESIAEQRLLWHLRRQTDACLHFPDDLDQSAAVALMRTQLGKDFDKHRFWLAIDSLGFVGSGLLMLIPGPNVLAYYFAFRLVGHYFSLRGARQGLNTIAWRYEASPPLTELRRAIALDPDARVRQVHDVASRLRLEHLASFFERAAVTTS